MVSDWAHIFVFDDNDTTTATTFEREHTTTMTTFERGSAIVTPIKILSGECNGLGPEPAYTGHIPLATDDRSDETDDDSDDT